MFFYTQKKKSLHFALRPNKSQKKIPLKIGQKIPWTYVFLILKFFNPHQNPMGLECFFRMQSLFVGQKKVASNWLRFQRQVAQVQAVIFSRGNWHKVLWARFSPVSTTFMPGSEGKGSVPKSCFKSAKNRSASSLQVSGHRYTKINMREKTPMVLGRFEAFFSAINSLKSVQRSRSHQKLSKSEQQVALGMGME